MSDTARTGSAKHTLTLGALGVVFGDIGTSPLYAFRESFTGHHKLPVDELHVLGVLSMLVWALILVVTLKYVFVTMRADNRGEGGSLALLALIERVAPKSAFVPYLAAAALLATAMFYGDAIITPAISILSAVEGLALIEGSLTAYIIPITLAIVVVLFSVQQYGTHAVARWFGPVMLFWFTVIGVLGLIQIIAHPIVLKAFNPTYATSFLWLDPIRAFFTLGTVVLAVTGAEALYADMGHFGRPAIMKAWLAIAFPALILCYGGQAALVITNPSLVESPFYALAPSVLLAPLVLLATVASIIASQSIISGAFSVTQQAVQLGYLPRLKIRHTSPDARGQVYSPGVNILLFVSVVALVLGFRTSSDLASAYGVAVTATMLLTTLMIGFVVFRIWRWNLFLALPVFLLLLTIDLGLVASSATKLLDGGWLPIGVAMILVFTFATWRKGMSLLRQQLATTMSVADVLSKTPTVYRPESAAVYLTSDKSAVPVALIHNLQVNHVLHARTVILTLHTALRPYVEAAERIEVEDSGQGILRVSAYHGFAEQPDIPAAIAILHQKYPWADPNRVTYFMSRQTILATDKPGMAIWREKLFALLLRNTQTPIAFFNLPPNRVVELGSQVEI